MDGITAGDLTAGLQEQVHQARRDRTALQVRGGGTKDFYGRTPRGIRLDVAGHHGVVDYEPTELVVTARAGTLLTTLEALLGEQAQMLPFEPPRFGPAATLGGAVASGLSGPRRPYSGAARDFVLGVRCLTGRGELLSFGGRVMKNVAGYDISRLMTGAMGTLGILLEVSLKVLPRPAGELTVSLEMAPDEAVRTMNRWAGRPLPVSATCYLDGRLWVRLSGSEAGVVAAAGTVGGQALAGGGRFWEDLREQRHAFFRDERPLWRISLPPAAPPLGLHGDVLWEWGGAQRWFKGDVDPDHLRRRAAQLGGHATLFRHGDRGGEVFHPLPAPSLALHRRLKDVFDPDHILNPGRLYAEGAAPA